MSDACGFCGHADTPEKVYAPLRSCIEELICRQGVREFYVGSEGAFDRMALRALREMKKKYPAIRYAVVLARLPGKAGPQTLPTQRCFPRGWKRRRPASPSRTATAGWWTTAAGWWPM